ncbi:MAG: flagellar biosynthetic protein FliO [Solirubrobacteraceae bacterium]|jgi:flagellar protein FliO/FliZ
MTVRRFLFAAAVAVLLGAPTSAAWAHGAHRDRAPVASTTAGVERGSAVLRAAMAKQKTAGKKGRRRYTGEFASENTPLSTGTTKASSTNGSLGGASVLRTIGGLLLVIAAIYGVTWVLRRVKRSRDDEATGRGLASIATLPLGSGRALHLVRAGTDVILVGVSETGVAPIQRYTEAEALANGVLDALGQDKLLHDAAGSMMPDGSPDPALSASWRHLGAAQDSSSPRLIETLRRLTVRS